MIARVWTARARPGGADAYAAHFSDHVRPALAAVDGCKGATLLRRARGESIELIVVSWWTSEDAIRLFAGDDYERAVVAEEARRVLTSFDDVVRHYDVVEPARLLVTGLPAEARD
jgi:heme-degrading monooxygenase HmoA